MQAAFEQHRCVALRNRSPDRAQQRIVERIAGADLPRLFERFYRGTAVREHTTGTGMGLSIARGLLGAQQGRIWAENSDDGGARFTNVVPAEVKPPA